MCEKEETPLTESRERAVRAELSGLLDSATFRTSKRCRDFLEYVVERTISQPSDSLKERSIGVELFQLPPDFDAGQHTIVRVTANTVRKKLAQHYLSDDTTPRTVRIELPPGSYRAEFRWEDPSTAPPPEPPKIQAPPGPVRPRWHMTAAVLGLLGLVSLAALWVYEGQKAPAQAAVTTPRATTIPVAPVGETEGVRLIVGAAQPYVDRSGITWGPDRYFSGGAAYFRSAERILRTLDPDVYRHLRIGEFRYDIPLKQGTYELHLHFAESGLADFISAESSGEGQRVFRVLANGKPVLDAFDVVADAAGANTADERVIRNLSPAADGLLHLNFVTMRGSPMLSALEVLPTEGGKARPVRIRAGWTASWQDSGGQQWHADSYFLGGNALVRTTNPAREGGTNVQDAGLYASERWGHFSYALPVADGQYRLALRFCEGHYGRRNAGPGGVGSRRFDVYCNGVALLKNFDIFKEAGGEGRPLEKAFFGVRPNAQGKIMLTFVPVEGMACVNGIEVREESQ